MPKSSTTLRLAQTTAEHRELDRQIERLVDQLCHHGESDCANSLFELIEVLTDTRTDVHDREGLAFQALQRAFIYTDAGRLALEQEITRINPRLEVPKFLEKKAS